jgi:predicted RNA binding protein YcfA (HicA-like mRNA interferase family)
MRYHKGTRVTRLEKLYMRVALAPANTKFEDAVHLAEAVGFELVRCQGSHHVFYHPDLPRVRLNLQPQHGKAKEYQVRDLLEVIEREGLWLR